MTEITEIINNVKILEKQQNTAMLELSKYEGQLEQEMKRLKSEYDLNSLKELISEVDKFEKKLRKIDEQIESKYNKLKEMRNDAEG
jgi:conjugal transfer/entry exclusion protein